jgi:hypothetical protein
MSEPNYAGNIIVILANLPDFLRTPILKKRMIEFFLMTDEEKNEIVSNALEAGPTIPFPNFSKLFKTWLQVLSTFSEEQRTTLFLSYITQIIDSPERLINFNLDGMLEIYLTLDESQQKIIGNSVQGIFLKLDEKSKQLMYMLIPDNVKNHLGV